MTYTTVGQPDSDVEKQKNEDLPPPEKNYTGQRVCFYACFVVSILLLSGFIMSLTFGAYYLDNPNKVQNVVSVKDGCLIDINGKVCTLYTVPEMYNQTIPCNSEVPPKRLDSLYSCWYSRGKLYLYRPSVPEWPAGPLSIGIMGTTFCGVLCLFLLVCSIIDCCYRCKGPVWE